jgi:hypothetical protein
LFACASEGDRPHSPLEQFHAEEFLKAAYLMAERAGRDAELSRRVGEAQMPRRRLEGAQRG